MNPKKSAKWIVGTVGVAFSAFVLSQFSPTPSTTTAQTIVNGQSTNSNSQSVDPYGSNQYNNNDNGNSDQFGDGGQNDQGGGSDWSFDNSQGNSGSSSDRQSGASGH